MMELIYITLCLIISIQRKLDVKAREIKGMLSNPHLATQLSLKKARREHKCLV